MACVGPDGFFEQGSTNPYGPACACLNKSSNKMSTRLAIFPLFSSVLVYFLIRSYDKMLIDWVRSGRTGKYLALGHLYGPRDGITSSQIFSRTARPLWARPNSVNKYIVHNSFDTHIFRCTFATVTFPLTLLCLQTKMLYIIITQYNFCLRIQFRVVSFFKSYQKTSASCTLVIIRFCYTTSSQ